MGLNITRIWRKNILGQHYAEPSRANYKFLLKDWIRVFDLSASSRVLETKRFSRQVDPVVMERPQGRRILVLAPHTDDDIYGPGGTLIKAVASGARVDTAYVVNRFPDTGRTEAIRQETLQVCAELGATPHFLDCMVGNIPLDDADLLDHLSELLVQVNPDTLFVTFLLDDHDDHRRVNHLLTRCLENTGLRPEIWAFQVYSTVLPNVVVEVTEEIDEKLRLMRLWKSVYGNRDWDHYIAGLNAFNCRFLEGPGKRYAETFFVVPAQEYMDLCRLYFRNGNVFTNKRYRKEKLPPC